MSNHDAHESAENISGGASGDGMAGGGTSDGMAMENASGENPSGKDASGAQSYTAMKYMPPDERPRERLQRYGPSYLSNAELIAILLRTGLKGENVVNLSARVLATYGGLGGVARVSYAELCDLHGISDAKACQILAALELGRRLSSLQPDDRPVIRSPQDVFNILSAEMTFLTQEHLRVLLLNTKNEVLAVREIYKGNVNSAVIRIAEVLRPAIRENCPSIIIAHNHPSGDPTPSPEDILVTRQIRTSAEMMDIELLDHVVIGNQRYVSLKERGLGFDAGAAITDLSLTAERR